MKFYTRYRDVMLMLGAVVLGLGILSLIFFEGGLRLITLGISSLAAGIWQTKNPLVRFGDDYVMVCGGQTHAKRFIDYCEILGIERTENQLTLFLDPPEDPVVILANQFAAADFTSIGDELARRSGKRVLRATL